jgi:hypothetical protein
VRFSSRDVSCLANLLESDGSEALGQVTVLDRLVANPDRMIRDTKCICKCPMPLQLAWETGAIFEEVFSQNGLNPVGG